MSMRLERQPDEVIDRDAPLTFTWNGRTFPAYAGDTIASALAACGVRVFSRSFKYHRPRGLLTASYLDPGCMVQVDDEPNVRGAHRLVEPGMRVSSQDTWPSLEVDVKAANQLVGRFLSAGFYYKTFMGPSRLWPAYEKVLERFAHGGEIPDLESYDRRRHHYDKRHAHPDVLVAGGGPAGMAAALAAAEAGATVLLVEEEHALGGHLRWGGDDVRSALAELRRQIEGTAAIEVLTDSVVLGRYDDNWVSVVQRGLPTVDERLVKARAKTLVVAAGLVERPYVFAGNDVPGVMLSTAVRRLIELHAVSPGRRAVVLRANPDGDAAVAALRRVGVEVVHVEDARRGGDIVRVRGRDRVRGVHLADGRRVACDLVVTATGWTAPVSLLTMAGVVPVYDARAARFRPDTTQLPDNILATGGVVGDGTLDELIAHGEATGRVAATRSAVVGRRWRAASPTAGGQVDSAAEPCEASPPALPVDPHPELFRARTHGIVDFSEDVSSSDLVTAVAEGYASAELAKRYTTATMGPVQGKLETVNVVAIVAEATGRSIQQTGTTTWRPPYAPVTLGALAGPEREPVRRSPLQAWHEQHGATPLVAGAWVRPDHYGDPAAEVRAVRDGVGLIDVTPIGKLELHGPDVPRLLNLVYVNRWSKLAIGRVRYGVMCAEDGVVLDDGVTARLAEHSYLMTTTSSGAATVWEWLESWLQTEHPEWQVHVTAVTTAYASINVAGPRSRELVRRVVPDVDLDPEAFPYMHVRTGSIAGVADCVLWRIGFTGELSYELHVPAGYGLHVWESLMAAGSDLGVRAFGVEAQRILRLEKGHLIVGQDTDGLTRAGSAGLDGLVKLDKEDFAGRPELVWQDRVADPPRLVALRTSDPTVVPVEGSQIVTDGSHIRGRITSSRMSPTLGRSVVLAQLDAPLADAGSKVTIAMVDGRRASAVVTEGLAQVDPEGERLHG
ncbi:MAG: (2Fe-2S)-binding protein [Nocardioidaceae bacterium]|nr:(2Fe-2S)-binding protein [Nocardioidaceae bacterium]